MPQKQVAPQHPLWSRSTTSHYTHSHLTHNGHHQGSRSPGASCDASPLFWLHADGPLSPHISARARSFCNLKRAFGVSSLDLRLPWEPHRRGRPPHREGWVSWEPSAHRPADPRPHPVGRFRAAVPSGVFWTGHDAPASRTDDARQVPRPASTRPSSSGMASSPTMSARVRGQSWLAGMATR